MEDINRKRITRGNKPYLPLLIIYFPLTSKDPVVNPLSNSLSELLYKRLALLFTLGENQTNIQTLLKSCLEDVLTLSKTWVVHLLTASVTVS